MVNAFLSTFKIYQYYEVSFPEYDFIGILRF